MELFDLLVAESAVQGFPISGALDIDPVLQDPFQHHIGRYDRWLQDGREGEMGYLRRGRDRRANPRLVFPEAESIFCVGFPYWRQPVGGERGPRYARYLKGRDYHEEMPSRLETLMREVQRHTPELRWKICVDTSAVLERSWAALAGLGWIGKNTMLIHPKYGSYFFIGAVLLNQRVNRGPAPLPNYCGNCTRCLDACPTRAFSSPGELDSRKCISYWTLEKRGELSLSPQQKKNLGTWVAGCDVCQEVCPFNIKPSREILPAPEPDSDATVANGWAELLRESPDEYKARVKNSSLNRVKPAQFSRNLAIALRNHLRTIQDSSESWVPLISERLSREEDPIAREEWKKTLDWIRERRS